MLQGQALLRYHLLWLLTSAKILTRRLGGCRTTHLDAPPRRHSPKFCQWCILPLLLCSVAPLLLKDSM